MGLRRLLNDNDRAKEIRHALETGNFENVFDQREQTILHYVQQLTRSPGAVRKTSIGEMRAAGLDDGEILEVNQVASYFAYVNSTVLGLGVTTEGDVVGLSPAILMIQRTGNTVTFTKLAHAALSCLGLLPAQRGPVYKE